MCIRDSNYGMPSFGYHKNYFLDENFLAPKKDYFAPFESPSYESSFLEQSKTEEPTDKNSEALLENILSGFDENQKKQAIENLIKDRENLKNKIVDRLRNIKNKISELRYSTIYQIHPQVDFKALSRIYSMIDQMSVEEEIKSWKDISFLQLKLLDENLLGGKNES